MISGVREFMEQMPARGASILSTVESTTRGGAFDAPLADEAALMNILRLLNRIWPSRLLTPVERAFVIGAKAMFEELSNVCDRLLEPPPIAASTTAMESEEASYSIPASTASENVEVPTTSRTQSRRTRRTRGTSSTS